MLIIVPENLQDTPCTVCVLFGALINKISAGSLLFVFVFSYNIFNLTCHISTIIIIIVKIKVVSNTNTTFYFYMDKY